MRRIPRSADTGHRVFESAGRPDDPGDEFDRVLEDFIQSITLSAAELAVFVAMPEASVSEVKRMFAVPLSRGVPPYDA